ncbi:Hypothetical protein AKI40_1184 [Enterobacter sp. FY-07]|nr:Hypothetical protein AKI40_1184 [Enterobacter sp. FY-07]
MNINANHFKGWIKLFVCEDSNDITEAICSIEAVSDFIYNDVLCVVIDGIYQCSYPIRFLKTLPLTQKAVSNSRGYWMPEGMLKLRQET